MVVGTLFLVQKVKQVAHCVHLFDLFAPKTMSPPPYITISTAYCIHCNAKVKPKDAVDAVCSGLVVYGGEDIVLWCKKVNQWMQWMQSAVDALE